MTFDGWQGAIGAVGGAVIGGLITFIVTMRRAAFDRQAGEAKQLMDLRREHYQPLVEALGVLSRSRLTPLAHDDLWKVAEAVGRWRHGGGALYMSTETDRAANNFMWINQQFFDAESDRNRELARDVYARLMQARDTLINELFADIARGRPPRSHYEPSDVPAPS